MKLSKTDMLFIRACKAKDPYQRLRSVYRRFYCGIENQDMYITDILARIVDETLTYSVRQFITDSTAVLFFKRTSQERQLWALINKIRYSKHDDFKLPVS